MSWRELESSAPEIARSAKSASIKRKWRCSELVRDSCQGWWSERPHGIATVFALDIERATFISWNTEHGQMIVRRWSPQGGYTKRTRVYP